MTGMVRTTSTFALAVLLAAACINSGCGGGEQKSASEQTKPSEGATAPSTIANEGSKEGPTAVQIQCAECMQSFDKSKMTEIGGRWYCEVCAPKQK